MKLLFNQRRESRSSFGWPLLIAFSLLAATLLTACGSSATDSVEAQSAVEPTVDSSLRVADTSPSSSNASAESEVEAAGESSGESGSPAGGSDSGGFSIDPADTESDIGSNASSNEIEPFPTLPREEENLHLETALAMIPDDANRVSFSHWNRIKRHNRVPQMTSEYDLLEKKRFMVQVLTKNQYGAVLDKEFFDVMADLWGWDSTDLVWEAEAEFYNMMDKLNVVRVRPNLDLEKLVSVLKERDFIPVSYEGITIYSMPLTEKNDWHNVSPLSIHNVAIFPDQDLIIMSAVIESVQRVIDTMRDQLPAYGDDPLVKRAAFQLVGMAAVEMRRGLETCEYYSAGMSDKGRVINAATEQLNEWPVAPYQLLALGTAFSNEAQVDLVLFHYDDFRQAQFDFEFRENLLSLGTSPIRNVPYSAQFILQDSELDDALMTFSLVPSPALSDRSGWPQTVIGWVQDQDALFAACVIGDFLGLDEMN